MRWPLRSPRLGRRRPADRALVRRAPRRRDRAAGGQHGLSADRRRHEPAAGGAVARAAEPGPRVDIVNDTITVEAGCMLAEVQHAARDAGRLFPLSLAAEGSCTIGGNLSTNAGGMPVLRYGNARELCLGLEVVTGDGEVWSGPARPAQGQHRL